ncbi:MAG: cyclic nucleotide-binding domain-containing protein [Beijerinckiaceae bacterium]|nr:cyclic nucleotide-binding domain-containing protein [Beijerinckiaceae bacterium]
MSPLFGYIWRNSRGEQARILTIVLASLPFYYLSLELPKYIVSDAIQGRAFRDGQATAQLLRFDFSLPTWLGSKRLILDGFALDRLGYLLALSGFFLLLVLVNGGFKYVVNMRKGALGERLLQRLRFDLFSSLLRLTPEAARHIKPSEAATIIKDEVEPIGGFVGDAFVQPFFCGGQALTALAFILLQSLPLGMIAAATVLTQAIIIPRLRHEQLRLAKQRQLASRALAGKIGEVVEALGEVANHGTQALERDQIARRLEALFGIRYRLYGRKFAVKLLNNLIAQAAPFLFYSIGGYYALTGQLDIGQLVAVIAAYRDLPPPIKDLIDWDQQRLDAEAKFQQVADQFAFAEPEKEGPSAQALPSPAAGLDPDGAIQITGLSVVGPSGDHLLDRVSLTLPLGQSILLADRSGEGAATLAQVLGGRITSYAGVVTLPGEAWTRPDAQESRRAIAYIGPEATIMDRSLRDNIIYGLRRVPASGDRGNAPAGETDPSAETLDLSLAGCDDAAGLTRRLISTLRTTGLDDLVFRFGLARRLSPAAAGPIARDIAAIRARIRHRLGALGAAGAIEPYEPQRYIRNGSIAENLLFGWPIDPTLTVDRLAGHAFVGDVLEQTRLAEPLIELGRRIAATMLEIFEGLPPDHMLFEQFAFFSADAFPAYREILVRLAGSRAGAADLAQLTGLAMLYCEPRHRLGFLDEALEQHIVTVRGIIHREPTPDFRRLVAFFNPLQFCDAAPLLDNLLFGAIVPQASSAQERIMAAIREALSDLGLVEQVFELGLDQQAGYGGRLLFPAARGAVALARSLIRQPQVLILNDALSALGQIEAAETLARIQAEMAGRTLIVTGRNVANVVGVDLRVDFADARVASVTKMASGEALVVEQTPPTALNLRESEDLRALRAVDLFAGIDTPRLRLLAFTSTRVNFKAGELMCRQGESSDTAYIVLSGTADVLIATADGATITSIIGQNAIIGEIGIVTGEPRSATIIAHSDMTTLRLRKEIFLALLVEFPQVGLSITRLMVRRLQDNIAAASSRGHGNRPQ